MVAPVAFSIFAMASIATYQSSGRPVLVYGNSLSQQFVDEAAAKWKDNDALTKAGWVKHESEGLVVYIHAGSAGFVDTSRLTSTYNALASRFAGGKAEQVATLDPKNPDDQAFIDYLVGFHPVLQHRSAGPVQVGLGRSAVVGVKSNTTLRHTLLEVPSVESKAPEPTVLGDTTSTGSQPGSGQSMGGELRFFTPGRAIFDDANRARTIAMRLVAVKLELLEEERRAALQKLMATQPIGEFVLGLQNLGRLPSWVGSALSQRIGRDEFAGATITSAAPSISVSIRYKLPSGETDSIVIAIPLR